MTRSKSPYRACLFSSIQAITANLVAKGNLTSPLILYNRTAERAKEHSSLIGNSLVVASLEEAVSRADMIWSCVQDQDAVEHIFAKVLAIRDLTGKLFVESSTVLPDVTNRIAKQVARAGGDFVAMPGVSIHPNRRLCGHRGS